MPRKRVYLESSVISNLTARPSNDILKLAKQKSTKKWWKGRHHYDLFVSKVVSDEIIRGDKDAARLRAETIAGLPYLPHTPLVDSLVQAFIDSKAVPPNALEDAHHIALAAVHEIDYLLTWNQTHIANPVTREQIQNILRGFLLKPPLILTPDQLLEIEKCKPQETD